MKIYVVLGATGEWSDRMEWMVFAFKSEEEAIAHVEACKKMLMQFDQNSCGFQRDDDERDALDEAMQELDPNFYEDYNGTYYFIREVVLK